MMEASPPAVGKRTDAELLSEFRAAGSERAFAEIVARHGPMVYRTCLGVLRRADEAEDAAQAVFLVLARKPGAAERTLASWLHGTAIRTSYNAIRARAHRDRREREAARRTEATKRMSTPREEGELKSELDRALLRLPGHLREAVVLRYLEGQSQGEAAQAAGCPQGTLGWRAMEGLSRLRGLLGRRGIAVTTGVLAAFLAQEASAAVPAAAVASLSALGAGAAASGPAVLLAEGVMKALFWVKVKIGAAAVAAAACAAPLALHLVANEEKPAPPAVAAVRLASFDTGVRNAAAAALSPDGRVLALAGADGAVRLVEVATGKRTAALEGHRRPAGAMAFSPDGRSLASGSEEGTAIVWDVAAGKPRFEVEHPTDVRGVAFSPDGALLATASCNLQEGLKLWDAATGLEKAVLRGHKEILHCVAFSPAAGLLASGGRDRTVRVWDTSGGERLVIRTNLSHVVGLAFSPDGKSLAIAGGAGGTDPTLQVRDTATGRGILALRSGKELVHCAAFSPDGKTLAWAADDGVVRLWDFTLGRERASAEGHSGHDSLLAGRSLPFLPDGRTLLLWSRGGQVRLWSPGAP